MTTFRHLDGNSIPSYLQSSLDVWYENIRDVELDKFSIADICRACRQELFLESIIPIAIKMLGDDILSGDLYDGELASVIVNVSSEKWAKLNGLNFKAKELLRDRIQEFDDDIYVEIEKFIHEQRNRLSLFKRRDKQGRLRIWINDIESWKGFEDVVSFFESEYKAIILNRLDAPDDSRVWDLSIKDRVLTLVHDDLFGNSFFSKQIEDEGFISELADALQARIDELKRVDDGR